ncbi:DUF2235 domain-containing protein [Mesorhizobium sp.]|uniref:phospholipase effector Tle1 domain-containing protein n=1 Tax=Mesorhizobium sp. TaxID=1871066 RepID=UPI0025E540DD|nr:DUF2235 domain-containing protein [Mesorhizobium sp.]
MSKRIVVCIDGTWNNAVSQASGGTNIDAIYQSLSKRDQARNYFRGVGEHAGALGKWMFGATGKGVFQTAREAWKWVAGNHERGDRIYIFGFSRGAFAARHLAGMIVRHGLRGWQGNIEEEFREWQVNAVKPCTSPREEVYFLGLFDCVPGNQIYVLRDRSGHLNGSQLEPGIRHFRHAMAIHERRWSFRPILFENTGNQETFRQLWFPGYHSDVGGGANVAEGLASVTLWWMLREAYGLDLEFDNIGCGRLHKHGHALGVLRSADPDQKPVCSDYLTTRLGFKYERSALDPMRQQNIAPPFGELIDCPRCGQEMFDVFLTDPGQRWLKSNGLLRGDAE